jgi:pilus assembly protein CpaF
MQIQLVIVQGGPRGRKIALPGREAVIGRVKGCTVRLAAHEVSRKHCHIREKNGKVTILDLSSSNGTYVNGRRIAEETLLLPGDKVLIGPVLFSVEPQGIPLAALPRADLDAETVQDVPFVIESADVKASVEILAADEEVPDTADAGQIANAGAVPRAEIIELPMAEVEESGVRSSRRRR